MFVGKVSQSPLKSMRRGAKVNQEEADWSWLISNKLWSNHQNGLEQLVWVDVIYVARVLFLLRSIIVPSQSKASCTCSSKSFQSKHLIQISRESNSGYFTRATRKGVLSIGRKSGVWLRGVGQSPPNNIVASEWYWRVRSRYLQNVVFT